MPCKYHLNKLTQGWFATMSAGWCLMEPGPHYENFQRYDSFLKLFDNS